MSKKKVASRSTMTLKDFHGGSIPSDLPLPSAPGMTVDRSIFERQGSNTWMSPTLGRGFGPDRSGFHRQSSGGVRTFEDKASYFPNPANIGRNYDEDERKPVDSRPRSSHSSDRFDDHAPGYEEMRARGGGYSSSERYAFEDQGSHTSSHPNLASEGRSSSGPSERFLPSHGTVGGTGFESDVYVHEDFGLIPVGPPPARAAIPQDHYQSRTPGTLPYQRDLTESRSDQQPSYTQQYPAHSQLATSPPLSWRNPAQQVQSSLTSGLQAAPLDSSSNVWTARRDGDLPRPLSESTHGENINSTPWRPQSVTLRSSETRAVDKVNSGRWQSDSSRSSGPAERQFSGSGLSALQKPSGAAPEYVPSDTTPGRYNPRGLWKGEGSQSDSDTHRQRYAEEVRSGHSEPDKLDRFVVNNSTGTRPTIDSGRLSYSESRGLSNVDDGRSEPTDQSKSSYRDLGKAGYAPVRVSGSGRFSSLERGKYGESPDASLSMDSGSRLHSENGRAPIVETGHELSGEHSAEVIERPKLKLLPRTKPLEKVETTPVLEKETRFEDVGKRGQSEADEKKQPDVLSVEARRPHTSEGGNNNEEDDEDANRRVERPKLNLKPRSSVTEAEAGEVSEKVRQAVFGGARPRELVLKERGVDDILNGSQETPATASLSTNSSRKWEQADDGTRLVKGDNRAEDKQDSWRSERAFERQSSHRLDRQESRHGSDRRWDAEKDNHWDQERVDGPRSNRHEFEKQDNKRDGENRRDIDKQESWRRPAESPASNLASKTPGPTSSLLVDPSPRGVPGRSTYSGASAAELAQAFSRSSSLSSTMTGGARGTSNNLRLPLSPLPKGFSTYYGNGSIGHHSGSDAPFSRLADGSPPSFNTSGLDYLPGSNFGLDQTNYFGGSGKLGGYGSGDLKRGSSFGRQGSGRDLTEEIDDFPGKRALPVRQSDSYFD